MNIKINKNDIVLIIILVTISILSIMFLNIKKEDNLKANVYYNNELILTIDLRKDNIYKVDGYNGKVTIKVKNKKIKVINENSPLHLCSKIGYISKSHETIICLPNKIVIEIDGKKNIDTIIK